MKLQLIRLGETLEALEKVKGDKTFPPQLQYDFARIYKTLLQTSELLSPLLQSNFEKDAWINHAHSLEFDGIPRELLLQSISEIDVKTLTALLRLTTTS